MTWDEFKQYAEPTDAPDDGVTHDMAPHEVRALIEKVVEYEALDWPTCSGEWLSGSGGHRRHGSCGHLAAWWHPADVFAYCDAHIVEHEKLRYWHVSTWRDQAEAYVTQLTSERERGAKADALMLEKLHEQVRRTENAVREEREANANLIRREADALVAEAVFPEEKAIMVAYHAAVYAWAGWIERGEHRE